MVLETVVTLDEEIFLQDAYKISDWLDNENVTRFISEGPGVGKQIRDAIKYMTCPVVTHLFCTGGNFYIIKNNGRSVGYLKLVQKGNDCEIVIVIGDENIWNMGIGTKALKLAADEAFFKFRYDRMIAKIMDGNIGSEKIFNKIGFTKTDYRNRHSIYEMDVMTFLKKAA